MKKTFALLFIMLGLALFSLQTISKEPRKLPSVKIKNFKGEIVDTKELSNGGKPFVINLWATWCKPCLLELSNISEIYEKWQEETGVKIIAVSIDDTRNSKKVAPFVNGRSWKYEFYLDENSDFKREMQVNNPPHTFLCNGNGEIVWEHNGYAPGSENDLYEQIKLLVTAEKK